MPQAPLKPGEKLYCLSYAPFHGGQTPLDPSTHIPAAQIERDLAQLARMTDCMRTYSIDYGLDQIAGIAARHGLKVIQGLWLSGHPDKNRDQIETAVALAKRYPDTIRAVVVGNEVLLRGEMSGDDLAATMRAVKARVSVPVTYADVWEFWLRNRGRRGGGRISSPSISCPIGRISRSRRATRRRMSTAIRKRVAAAFPGKEVLIGEVGWPSAGRMREGALPSPANQARVIQEVLALAARENFRVNVIEAYDQPWKRALEGTVGGHWGLIGDGTRQFKFAWGEAVSNHPLWLWQAAGGIAFAFVVFGAAIAAARGRKAAANRLARGDRQCDGRWRVDRLDDRQCAARKPGRRRLAALDCACRRRGAERAAGERRGHARRAAAAIFAIAWPGRGALARSACVCGRARC